MNKPQVLGWREWISLPELGLPDIKAKVDTGARTSCLHAFSLEHFEKDGKPWVRFLVHPHQQSDEVASCEAPILDERMVTDSGGHREQRPVISTRIKVGDWQGTVEMTLTARDNMKFRMLLGRTAITQGSFLVDPALSYQQGGQPNPRTPA